MNSKEILHQMERDASIVAQAEFTACEIPRYISLASSFGQQHQPPMAAPAVAVSASVSFFILPSGKSVCFQWCGLSALVTIIAIVTATLACAAAISSVLLKIIWLFCWMIEVVLLLKIHISGPGYIGFPCSRGAPPNQTVDLLHGVMIRCKSCRTCCVLRPPRGSHCRVCGCCVAGFDHHCVLLGSCVGRDNIRFFITFLWFTLIIVVTTFAIAVSALNHTHYVAALIVVIVDAFCVIPVLGASVFYFMAYVVYGVTLREWRKRGAPYVGVELAESWTIVPRPFNSGAFNNLRQLFTSGT
ncbi:zinc finger protein, putative [Bodo saltans]|uniref:Palmitoyltransferase n=1 Tax=Bodo saltans TaxID=75058 RepID=A0A0S4INR8_BODSA|nr:zinc finger protein, putative [Bodo saltans]|eukprot:CUE71711.1 zinc finger protein, putative [Bodo saltans]